MLLHPFLLLLISSLWRWKAEAYTLHDPSCGVPSRPVHLITCRINQCQCFIFWVSFGTLYASERICDYPEVHCKFMVLGCREIVSVISQSKLAPFWIESVVTFKDRTCQIQIDFKTQNVKFLFICWDRFVRFFCGFLVLLFYTSIEIMVLVVQTPINPLLGEIVKGLLEISVESLCYIFSWWFPHAIIFCGSLF